MSYERIADALRAEGFYSTAGGSGSRISFQGTILCNGVPVPVEVLVPDLDFIVLPEIRILERPKTLQGFQPHFGVNDVICYADRNQIILDRYRPAETIIGCLRKAELVLGALSRKQAVNDTHEEFIAYWPGSHLLIDCPTEKKGALDVTFVKTPALLELPIISNDAPDTVGRLERSGWSETGKARPCAILIRTESVLAVWGESWPPSTIGEILGWIRSIDEKIYQKIYRELAQPWIVRSKKAFFLIRASNGDYGFSFEISCCLSKAATRKPSIVRSHLMGKGAKTKVDLHIGYPVDHGYIHARNLRPRRNLRDKRILVAGCGTIGGYLGTYLARLGAGEGKGRLILADPDILIPGNLGRHVLGMDALFRNKADAVAELLHREFPHLNVESRPANVLRVKDLFQVDLLIDATGEETLSTAINDRLTGRRQRGVRVPDALYVWIDGPGVQVTSLLVDSSDTACYRCLRMDNGKGELVDRFGTLVKVVGSDIVQVGCDSYMPFPVSASVQAASLAVESSLDWINGHPSPRFRTRVIYEKSAKKLKDQDVKPLPACPACRKK